MKKRVSFEEREQQRGQGAQAYTMNLGKPEESLPSPVPSKPIPKHGILVKLPINLIQRRDKIWRARLEIDPKAEKSKIVEEALQEYLDRIEREGDQYTLVNR